MKIVISRPYHQLKLKVTPRNENHPSTKHVLQQPQNHHTVAHLAQFIEYDKSSQTHTDRHKATEHTTSTLAIHTM